MNFNLIWIIIIGVITCVPFLYFSYNILNRNLINYLYLLKFLIFNLFLLFYNFVYIVIYTIFFIFKNYRFYGYYYANSKTSKFYYNQKSIYFLFWRYLTIFIITYLYQFIIYLYINFVIQLKKALFINNVYLFLCIYLKLKWYLLTFYKAYIFKILQILYNLYIYLIYHLFYFINIDEFYKFIKNINVFNNLKYLEDPLGYRNSYLTLSTNFYTLFNNINNNKYKQYLKIKPYKLLILKVFFGYILYMTQKLNLFFDGEKNRGFRYLLSKVFLVNKIFKKQKFFILLKIIGYYLNLLFINVIYIIIMSFVYLIYSSINFIILFRYWILYFLLFFVCLKYYWIFYYFFLILYKHYVFNLPLFEIKESNRFFNFEWIDLRNYYNLIFYHNTLVDLTPLNNLIYNDLLNNLNKALSLYGFKITNEYDISMYAAANTVNHKDTHLLNNLIGAYNEVQVFDQWQWYANLKKIFENEAQVLFQAGKIDFKDQRWLKQSLEENFNNIAEKETVYLKKSYPFTNEVKIQLYNWNFFNKNYFKTRLSQNQVVINIWHFIKIKNIPLRYIHLYKDDKYYKPLFKILQYTDKICDNHVFLRGWQLKLIYLFNLWKKMKTQGQHTFYFDQIYNFDEYKELLVYKHKIPTFNWTPLRWRKKVPDELYVDFMYLSAIEEDHPFDTYQDLAKKKVALKRNYKYSYISHQYPYNVTVSNNDDIVELLNYYNVLKSNIKIVKKYTFLNNSKIYYNKKHYTRILEFNELLVKLFLNRLKVLDYPLIKGHLYEDDKDYYLNLNFWFFFDYLKVDKYYHIKNPTIYKSTDNNINLLFIKRLRKDYTKYRVNLLRMYSLYFYYYYFEYMNIQHFWPDGTEFEKNEQIELNFESLKLSWYLNSYLSNDRHNIKLFKNVDFLSKLFKIKFWAYYVYCDYSINSHNEVFTNQIEVYRLSTLNKISNLKRFFFYHNKNILNSSMLKYFNTFSLQFHIKHLLWHSPYSFIFFKTNLITPNIDCIENKKFEFFYIFQIKENQKIKLLPISIHKYSIIFNLFLNIAEIKKDWIQFILYEDKGLTFNIEHNNEIFYNTFYYYSNNGKFNYKTLHYLDIYRFLINLIYYYYNNFLYKLVRYRYILDYKKYTIFSFIKRFLNLSDRFWNQYIRFRLQIYRYLFYGKFIKKSYYTYFKLKNLYSFRARKIEVIPFWFIFDTYIKLFIYFILKNYYTKNFFVHYWFFNILNYKIIYLLLGFYNFKYLLFKIFQNLYFTKYLYINLFICSILNKIYNYSLICYQNLIYSINYDYDLYNSKFIFKIISWISNSLKNIIYFYIPSKKDIYMIDKHRSQQAEFSLFKQISFLCFYQLYKIFDFFNFSLLNLKFLWKQIKLHLFFNLKILWSLRFYVDINKLKNSIVYLNLLLKLKNFNKDLIKFVYLNIFIFNMIDNIIIVFIDNNKNNWVILFDLINYIGWYIKFSIIKEYKHFYYFYKNIKMFILNLNIVSKSYNNIKNKIKLIKWYILLIFQYNFNVLLRLNYINLNALLKFYLLNSNIKFNIKFNKLILIKLYIEKLLVYYWTILFKVKNSLIYFKPNYYYFRKQRSLLNFKRVKLFFPSAFSNTTTYRNIHSFKHLTFNITFIKNIYLINIYNYIYLLNSYDIVYENIFNLLFFLLKYNYDYYLIFYYIILYWIILLFFFFYNKKFYNIFFFCNNKNTELQYNWNKLFNDKALNLSAVHTRSKHKIYNLIWKKLKFHNFYNFIFFNIVFKNSKIKNYIYKTFLLSNLYVNKLSKLFNNNELLDLNKGEKMFLDFNIFINGSSKLLKNFQILPFIIKKEKKEYKIFSLNLLNNNVLNFCILYWLIIIPYFFFEYVLMRYHLKGHLRAKRKLIIFIKLFLDNFKMYIKFFKLIGEGIYTNHKVRYPKNYYNTQLIRKKKKLKFGYFFKWDRSQKYVTRISPMGTYYYWFFNINRLEYFISAYKYFFIFSFFSNYFCYLYLYIFLFIIILKTYKIKSLKFNFIYNKFNLKIY